MTVRRGGPGDLDLVCAIQRESALAGYARVFPPDVYPYPDEQVRAALTRELAAPDAVLLVDGDGAGFALVLGSQLDRLYVRPRAWGNGLAAALHDAALEAVRATGATHATLWCLADNARARRFYERRGWRLDGREQRVSFPPHPVELGYTVEV